MPPDQNERSESDSGKAVAGPSQQKNLEHEPLRRGFNELLSGIVTTGRLEGAPDAHRRLANYVEYAQAIINQTITVAEAITSSDLDFFALGLPSFTGQRRDQYELDARDVKNLACLERLLPDVIDEANTYHLSSTFYAGKLMYVATVNPRACEWIVMAAIMIQKGLGDKITQMLIERKDRFIEVAQHAQIARQSSTKQTIDPAIIAYSSRLDRVIVSLVTSMKNLQLGQLGGELSLDGDLPPTLDFDHYVTGDPVIHQVAKEALALGIQFNDEVLFIHPGDSSRDTVAKRPRHSADLTKPSLQLDRWQRTQILSTEEGTSRYQIVNKGPTGRVPHARLVSGLLARRLATISPPGQREKFCNALQSPASVKFTLEVDLNSGIAEICVNDDESKGILPCPPLSIESDIPVAANIQSIPDILDDLRMSNFEFLDFSHVASPTTITSGIEWRSTVLTYLVVKGWWWSKHLIHDYPVLLYVPSHVEYFGAMANIGAVMLHLEQDTKCGITTNMLFNALRLLTNIGSTNEAVSGESVTYAAQGPGGTLVHDVLSIAERGWSSNPYLSYQWLRGKFTGIPETALLGQSPEYLKEAPMPVLVDDVASRQEPSLTIFADSTDGHTLRCAIVNDRRSIRSIPFSRVLCGLLLARIGAMPRCDHPQEVPSVIAAKPILQMPWRMLPDQYYGRAELREDDCVLITEIEGSKLCQVLALGVTLLGTAIDTRGCVRCAFERSVHVIRLPPGGLPGSMSYMY